MVCKEDADVSSLSIFISFLPQKILVLIFIAGLCSLEFKSALFPMFNALSSFIFSEHPCPLCSGNYHIGLSQAFSGREDKACTDSSLFWYYSE